MKKGLKYTLPVLLGLFFSSPSNAQTFTQGNTDVFLGYDSQKHMTVDLMKRISDRFKIGPLFGYAPKSMETYAHIGSMNGSNYENSDTYSNGNIFGMNIGYDLHRGDLHTEESLVAGLSLMTLDEEIIKELNNNGSVEKISAMQSSRNLRANLGVRFYDEFLGANVVYGMNILYNFDRSTTSHSSSKETYPFFYPEQKNVGISFGAGFTF